MRIYENGTIRDMTAEEIAEVQAMNLESAQPEELTNEKKLSLFLASIPTQDTPSVEPKLGYKWQPMYSGATGFAWELVEDPNALGTQKNPLQWINGMNVKMGYHYTVDGKIYLALEDGTPEAITDETYFAEL